MSLAIYYNEQHAVIRAMAVDSISTCEPSVWQRQYSSGYVEDLTKRHNNLERLNKMERLAQDCMTRARLHKNTPANSFYAVIAKYSVNEQERANAVNELVKAIDCDGVSDDFKRLIIWTWASVKIKRGFIERIVDMCEQSRATTFRKKKIIIEQLDNFEDRAKSDLAALL